MSIPGKLRHYIKFSLAALLWAASMPAFPWGPQGHRVAGALTVEYLSPAALAEVEALLGSESLADASTWADRMRDSPSPFWQKTAGPYHYVTVRSGKSYSEIGPPGKGDSVTALAEFGQTLTDPAASRAHRQLALRFSVHIIQDLHQPLHVGNGRDRGGNNVKLKLRGKSTNLHRVWDSSILAVAGRSDRDWVARLSRITPQQARDWTEADPLAWIAESASLREQIYPEHSIIDDDYLRRWLPKVELRLQQSAVRTAAWLNSLDL